MLFRADVAMTNTLKLLRQRHTDGATIEPVCYCVCVCFVSACMCVSSQNERDRLAVAHTNTRPFLGFQTRTGRQSGFSL